MPEVNRFKTTGEAETLRFASSLAKMLNAGDTILLEGDLGTGKSVFARGVARALGITCAMPSPTFTIMIPYEGEKKLYHFDLYRLGDPDEFYAAGLDEFVGGDGIALVEWPQMAELDVRPCIAVTIERGEADDDRYITLENRGVTGYREENLNNWSISL